MNMYTSQILYQSNHDEFTYHCLSEDGFNNEDCDLKMDNRKNQDEWENVNKIL